VSAGELDPDKLDDEVVVFCIVGGSVCVDELDPGKLDDELGVVPVDSVEVAPKTGLSIAFSILCMVWIYCHLYCFPCEVNKLDD
jgi:hypothetical protein